MQPDVTSSHDVVRVAAKAVVSPQTVRRYLSGDAVNDNSKTRIREALATLGFRDPNEVSDDAG